MDSVWSFKTFNLGRGLETAGEFIYESAKKMIGIKNFYNKYEVNAILYLGYSPMFILMKHMIGMKIIYFGYPFLREG